MSEDKIDRIPLTCPTLSDVYDAYRKYLYVKDTKRIDIIFAVALTRPIKGTKVWLLIIGNSGDWKSEQLVALDDSQEVTSVQMYQGEPIETTTKVYNGNFHLISSFTPRTLITGMKKSQDLAPKLRDKVVLIPEMSQILKLPPNDKAEMWAQLRDLYDGKASKNTGGGKNVSYDNLNVTLIGGSTQSIDSQILIHQDLGSRELVWRTNLDNSDEGLDETMNKCLENEKNEVQMRDELKDITFDFLATHKYIPMNELPPEINQKIKRMVQYLRFLRAPAELDTFTGELLGKPHPEMPTRVYKQYIRIYYALKSLDPEYSDERALEVLEYLTKSSCFPNRVKLFDKMLDMHTIDGLAEYTSFELAQNVGIGRKAVTRELNVLWGCDLIIRRNEVISDNFGNERERVKWSLNVNNSLVKSFIEKVVEEKII